MSNSSNLKVKSNHVFDFRLLNKILKSFKLSDVKNAMIKSLVTQLDFHTHPILSKSNVSVSDYTSWLTSRDSMYAVLIQSLYEFIHIFTATVLSNSVQGILDIIDTPILHTIFRLTSVIVYLVYLTEQKIYSEVLRYCLFAFVEYVINPLYTKLTGNKEINGTYVYFTIVTLKIFYQHIIKGDLLFFFNYKKDGNLFIKLLKGTHDNTLLKELEKATDMSHMLNLTTFGGVNLIKGIIKILNDYPIHYSRIGINFVKKVNEAIV